MHQRVKTGTLHYRLGFYTFSFSINPTRNFENRAWWQQWQRWEIDVGG